MTDPIDRPTDLANLQAWLAAHGDVELRPEGNAAGEPGTTLSQVLAAIGALGPKDDLIITGEIQAGGGLL